MPPTSGCVIQIPDSINVGLLVVGGSRAYGLDTPTSDWDYRGFFVAPVSDLVGLRRTKQTWEQSEPDDIVLHEVGPLATLALSGNPTFLEVLSTPDPLITSPLADDLRANMDAFLSEAVRQRFYGYAVSQLKAARNAASGRSQQPSLKAQKSARHLLRVLQQGIHLLETGEVRVRVPNRDELFEFGKLPISQIEDEVWPLLARLETMPTVLRPTNDAERINEILVGHRLGSLGLNHRIAASPIKKLAISD